MADPRRDIERLAEIQDQGPLSDERVARIVEMERGMSRADERAIYNKIFTGEISQDEALAYGYRLMLDHRAHNALDELLGRGDGRAIPERDRTVDEMDDLSRDDYGFEI
jgi:hypothetical protein